MIHPKLTVLIPFYNEAGNVLPLLEEIHEALDGIAFEIVCVDDCSSDTTGSELREAGARWADTISIFTHVRRAGKSAALFTGLKAARGTWTQLLDGDGQNDIADTARLWPELIEGHETGRLGIIAGKRNSRNDSGFKWLQSRIANGVRRFVLRDTATDTGCGWKLIRTDAFRELPYFASMHRFLPALIKRAGQSKYGFLSRLGAGIFDLMGMFWLIRRGGYGVAAETDDPRA